MSQATLLVVQGVDQGSRFTVGEEPVGIGRGVRNEVRILDTEVSRQHARVRQADESFIVEDRNSSNGTFVNGRRIETHTLSGGDQIQMGRTILLFNQGNAALEESPAAEKISLVGQQKLEDRSQIVNEVAHQAGQPLLGQTVEAGQPALANLQVLYRISEEAVSPSIPIDQMLKHILELTIEVLAADRGCMLLADSSTGEIQPQVFSHRPGVDAGAKMPVSRSIVNYVLDHGQGVRTSDARRDERFETGQSILQAGIREAMCVPMQGRYQLMGVIYVDTTTPSQQTVLTDDRLSKFTEEQLRLLVAIGRQSALAVENNRYQQALVKAERLAAMGQTVASLSHHIKNILQGVRGGSYLIDRGLNNHDEELVRKGWGIVEKNQEKIYHLVLDMLTFSKERQPALEQASLNETVAEVCELIQAKAEEGGVELVTNWNEELPVGTFDPEGIHRAVLNIVTNAIDALEDIENGRVLVETDYDTDSDSLIVVVTDNGPGIPQEQFETIFNAFESTKGASGTGLGLAVSRKIIREHGGEIEVDSQADSGCQFRLIWPRAEDEQLAAEKQTTA